MGRSVLVTGSARRIGRRLALDLAADGWDVAVHCNASLAEAEEVAAAIRALGRRVTIVRGDLSHDDVPDRLIAEASAALGGLTCLINNASLFEPDEVNHVEQVDDRDLDRKLAALEAHTSQMETTHFYKVGDGDPLEGFRRGQRDRLAAAGALAGVPMAEAYHLIVDQL